MHPSSTYLVRDSRLTHYTHTHMHTHAHLTCAISSGVLKRLRDLTGAEPTRNSILVLDLENGRGRKGGRRGGGREKRRGGEERGGLGGMGREVKGREGEGRRG